MRVLGFQYSLGVIPVLFSSVTSSSLNNDTQKCHELGSLLQIPNAQLNVVEFIPNGTNVSLPDNDKSCNMPYQLVYGGDLCRIAMYVATSNSSGVTFETWLPTNWSGRFLALGNGGLAGCIYYDDLAYGSSLGFATVGSNNGHNGTSGKPFLNSPGVVEDYSYRALHTAILAGKKITSTFYDRAISKSYYSGCSSGGRQGMKEALDYPEDFDGIVVGAPAIDFNNLNSWRGWLSKTAGLDNTSSSFVTESLWNVVHKEILRQCDGLDGAVDGIIEDPDLCRPILSILQCSNTTTNKSTCLNSGQQKRVQGILSDLYGENGTLVFPRLVPGAEVGAFAQLLSGQMFSYSLDWFRYVVYNNPLWDPSTLSLTDVAYSARLNPFNIATFSSDLSAFNSHGGKLLMYHGMQDQRISPDNTARYYQQVSETMSLAPRDIDDFYRFFRIGGMGHCNSGPGAHNFGQGSGFLGGRTPQDNVLLAIVNWVENAAPPEFLRGYKYVDDSVAKGVAFSRKHCKYPARNVYVGPGNYTDENAWHCGI